MSKMAVALVGLETESLGDQIACLYTRWNNARLGHRTEVAEIIRYVYATDTKQTANKTNPWSHSTHIPKLTQIHDNLATQYANALVGRDDFFTFEPGSVADAKKRKAVVSYLKTKHKYSRFKQAIKLLLNDWVQQGNCFGQLHYVVRKTKDWQTGVESVDYQGPVLERINPSDIEFDPTAPSFAESAKIVRQVVSMGEFIREAEEKVELRYDPAGIAKVRQLRLTFNGMRTEDQLKIDQRQVEGFENYGSYLSSGKVELLHFYGDIYDPNTDTFYKDRMITVVDRRYVLRNLESNDYGNIGKIYHCGWRKRNANLWAQGPLANLVGMQYLIDHLENARADAFDQMLSPDEVYIGQVNTIIEGATRKHYVDDKDGDVKYLRPDATILQADNQIALKEAQMEAYAGAPREAMGIRTAGEKTAFEVESLQNAAGRLFQNKIDDFELEFLDDVLNGEIELAHRNLDSVDVAETQDEDFGVTEFRKITKADLRVKGKLVPQGASHFAKRSTAVRELQQFSATLQADQALAVHFPAKERAKAWNDLMEFDRYKLFVEFGGVGEQVELAQFQQAAQSMLTKQQAGAAQSDELEMEV